jgi:hypothetical protein
MYLRYLILDEFGDCIRKMASRIECEPYLRGGCTLKVMPRVKQPTPSDMFNGALELLGGASF